MIAVGQTSPFGFGDAEPSLDELLSEGIIVALMQADHVTLNDVQESMSTAKRRRLSARERRNFSRLPSPSLGAKAASLVSTLALEDDASLAGRGVRQDQIIRLGRVGETFVEEVHRMLATVGLDEPDAPLPLPVRIDLHLACIECADRPRCRRWLAGEEADEDYRLFCPNASIFDRAYAVQRWRRGPPEGLRSGRPVVH